MNMVYGVYGTGSWGEAPVLLAPAQLFRRVPERRDPMACRVGPPM